MQCSNAEGEFPLKLLINGKTNKVLFAEAGKELVDFLFGLMSVPLGAVVALLGKQSVPGSIGTLYKSIEDLGSNFFSGESTSCNEFVKNELLNPPLPSCRLNEGAVRLAWKRAPASRTLYTCSKRNMGCSYVSNVYEAPCPNCSVKMTDELTLLQRRAHNPGAVKETEKGFVKPLAIYAITDDLSIDPFSAGSSFGLMNLKENNFGSLEEKTVIVGAQQAAQILKTALQSTTVLSDVFIAENQVLSGAPDRRDQGHN